MKSIYALIVELACAGLASAHGVPVIRSQVVMPYQPVVQVQAVYAAPIVQAYAVQQVVQPVCVQSYAVQQVVQPACVQSFAVRQQVIRQNVIQVRQPRVFQRSVTRSRTIIR